MATLDQLGIQNPYPDLDPSKRPYIYRAEMVAGLGGQAAQHALEAIGYEEYLNAAERVRANHGGVEVPTVTRMDMSADEQADMDRVASQLHRLQGQVFAAA